MILRMLILVLALSGHLKPSLFAVCERGERLISEAGGIQGIQGVPGIPGASGLLDFADFYALMPTDNPLTIPGGIPVAFPGDGPTSGSITRSGLSSFILPTAGSYLVQFQASITEPAQLVLRLNGLQIPNSVAGRATGTSKITGMSVVTTTSANSILEVVNPSGNLNLTLTPSAGQVANPNGVSAHLVIVRIR